MSITLSDYAGFLLIILLISALLVVARIIRGPTMPDRVVGLDMLSVLGISIIATYSIAHNEPSFMDVAVVLALISFLGTVAFATYLQIPREKDDL